MISETWIQKITLPDGRTFIVLQPLGIILRGQPKDDIRVLSVKEENELREVIETYRRGVVIEEFR